MKSSIWSRIKPVFYGERRTRRGFLGHAVDHPAFICCLSSYKCALSVLPDRRHINFPSELFLGEDLLSMLGKIVVSGAEPDSSTLDIKCWVLPHSQGSFRTGSKHSCENALSVTPLPLPLHFRSRVCGRHLLGVVITNVMEDSNTVCAVVF